MSPLADHASDGDTKPFLPSNGNSVLSVFYAILTGRNRSVKNAQYVMSPLLPFDAPGKATPQTPGRCRDVQVSLVHQNASLVGVFCSSLPGLGDNRPNPRDLYMETSICRCFLVQARLVHEPSRANQPIHKQKRPAFLRGVHKTRLSLLMVMEGFEGETEEMQKPGPQGSGLSVSGPITSAFRSRRP